MPRALSRLIATNEPQADRRVAARPKRGGLVQTGNEARLVSGGMTDWLERGCPIERGD
jgi:hypothetical protein